MQELSEIYLRTIQNKDQMKIGCNHCFTTVTIHATFKIKSVFVVDLVPQCLNQANQSLICSQWLIYMWQTTAVNCKLMRTTNSKLTWLTWPPGTHQQHRLWAEVEINRYLGNL